MQQAEEAEVARQEKEREMLELLERQKQDEVNHDMVRSRSAAIIHMIYLNTLLLLISVCYGGR